MLRCGEMSVLERQRAVLERLYNHSKQQLSSLPQQDVAHFNNLITGHMMMGGCVEENFTNFNMFGGREHKGLAASNFITNNNCQEMARPSFSTVSNSSITTVSPPPEKENDLSTIIAPRENVVSTKKRKAEIYEEEDCKTKRPEGKTGEVVQSEISDKSQRGTTGNDSKENSKTSEVQKPDYIHVRARRGQATDSHSLAERARREKISKKMKYLQDLVPGCNKVTGKAGMLDEIINYVQSLQKQVEFLSMKLAALNPRLDLNTDNIFTKDFPSYMATTFPTLWEYNIIQHQQGSSSTGDVAQMLAQRRDFMSFPEAFLGSSPLTAVQQQQQPTFETDLQNLFSVGFN
ncbi:hypothetical protein HAX54_040739 [Datura stramonium]|uniref:BHLH domain-containing protein n=1 Tax=Datura stramonium TaxID=4076 RepID=A0ABS8VPP7_DATST|nr:hypothetical protein [Datura stramonium]